MKQTMMFDCREWSYQSQKLGQHLFEVESMGDVVCCQEGSDQMGDWAGLTTVGTKLECVQSSLPMQRQENAL